MALMDPIQPDPGLGLGVSQTQFRRFDDIDEQRRQIYDQAKLALQNFRPLQNATHRLEVADVDYDGPFEPTKADEKKAILQGVSLHRPLRGTVRLVNQETGQVEDEQRATLARIPHLNSRGLFIRNGVVWSLRNQARLRPGAYTRRRTDGGTETHFNVRPGTGRGFRLLLEPQSGLFKIQVGQSTTRLYPILRELGMTDEQIKERWGQELFDKNYRAPSGKDVQDLRKVVGKLASNKVGNVPDDLLKDVLKEALTRGELDEDTTEITLGQRIKNLSPEVLLDSTGRVLKVARGEARSDNRDSQAFQSVHAAEDFVRERLERDQSGGLRKLLWKAAKAGKLGQVPTGVLDKNIGSIFEGSGLAMAVEDINPFEIHDQRQAVTRLGQGGISSEQSVSREARGVQPSYIGVIDAGRGPESQKLGLDLRVTDAAMKGSDNQLYTTVLNRQGKPEIVSARTLSQKVVTFPGEMERDAKRVPAIKNEELTYVPKDEVDYVVPNPNALMSRATAMIPFPEAIKGQRLLMGARMSVSGDTEVLVRRCDGSAYYGPIRDYVWRSGDRSVSIDKQTKQVVWREIQKFIPHKNVLPMLRVRLKSGRYIDATADHSFVTLGEDGSLVKTFTQDLQSGSPIPTAKTIPVEDVAGTWDIPDDNAHSACSFDLDYNLGWIHGLYLSEGYGHGRDRRGNKTAVVFANCDLDVLDRVEQFFSRVGVGAKPMSGRADNKLDQVRVHWQQLYHRLSSDYGDGAYNKRLPGWVFFAPKEFRSGIIAGYLAGDGGCFLRRGRVRVNGSSRSRELVVGLSNLCATLGIMTTQSESEVLTGPGSTQATQHYFEIRAESISDLPTLGCNRKDERIAQAEPWSGKRSADWIPMYKRLRNRIASLTDRKSMARRRAYVDQHTRRSLTEIGIDDPWIDSDVMWDRVAEVVPLDARQHQYVYDLDMGDNVFLAGNGVFVHNTQQAMPLKDAEAPLVQTADADGVSLHEKMGTMVGAARSPVSGIVTRVTDDEIHMTTQDGQKKVIPLYNNYPAARKTVVHNTPVVQKGDLVDEGQLLARSNFTDDQGVAAIGRNLRTAFMAAEGDTIEDAFVISESAAKKLMSEALYKSDLDLGDVDATDKRKYRAIYADRYNPEQYDKLDDDGVIRPGMEVQPGDPLILGFSQKPKKHVGALMNSPRSAHTDRSQTWEHHAPGVVTDVVKTRKGIKVAVKSYDTMKAADKLTGRYGNKGVISAIRPDEQMPVDQDGQPIEVIANSLGIVSRTNPGALAESLLGKVAAKTGKPYNIQGFSGQDVANFAIQEALKHGVIKQDPETGEIIDTQTLVDPRDGRKIPNVFTGVSYFMKPQHMAESKLGARDVGTYTTEGLPAKGGKEGSKRIAMLDSHALLAAGATNFLRDAKLVRGQRNDEYWRAIRNGEMPAEPQTNFADEHFKNLLRGAGVNLREKGTRTQLAPMLDQDVDQLAEHEIQNPGTFDFETMKPKPGGLFDVRATGGAEGTRFSKITLPEPVPHPLFTDPIQKLLGLTGKKLEAVMAGQEELHGKTGPQAIGHALSELDIDREIAQAKEQIRSGRKTHRDQAVKRLNYLTGLKDMDVQPQDLLVSKIPVIPPKFRPISQARGMDMIHDLNYLYHDLLVARDNYRDAQETFGQAGDEYLDMWNAVRAISGVRDPVNPKSAEQNVRGILRHAIGVGDTPKRAFYQRKVIGSAVDSVGRGVITADKNLDMDEVGVPKDMAIKIFRPYVLRRLARQGMPATEAMQALKQEKPVAMKALQEEMKERPVVYNRAPALHRYAYVGAYAKLRDDDAIGMPYQTLKGIGGDFDGDQINIHVPASEDAVQDVREKLMPSKNLFFTGTFETHLEPMQDYLAGLYLASQPDEGQPVQTFATAEEARAAYARGEISARTPIQILDQT